MTRCLRFACLIVLLIGCVGLNLKLQPALAAPGPLDEAKLAVQLTHPNIAQIYDVGESDDGLLYMVMEMIEGHTLAERIDRDGPLRPETVVRIMAQVCGSLAEAHGRGMVHRDLKPSNIMLTQRGSEREFVKVLDFGLVKGDPPGLEHQSLTREGAHTGTPAFLPPESQLDTRLAAFLALACASAAFAQGEAQRSAQEAEAKQKLEAVRDAQRALALERDATSAARGTLVAALREEEAGTGGCAATENGGPPCRPPPHRLPRQTAPPAARWPVCSWATAAWVY